MSVKHFIIILTVLLASTAGLGYYFFFLKETPPDKTDVTSLPTGETPVRNDVVQVPIRTNVPFTGTPRPTNQEEALQYDIRTNIESWQKSGDQTYLKQALVLTENPDNESPLEAWVPFLRTESAELIKVVSTSMPEERPQLVQNALTLMDWFIEMSAEYQALPPSTKQEILKGYEQLKVYSSMRS